MDHQSYDTARAIEESQSRGHKRGGYIAQRISKRVNADVTPDEVKALPQIGAGAAIIVHYDNTAGFRGRLLGILMVADGRTTNQIKVWDSELHHQVMALLGAGVRVVRVETKPSSKWGDALTRIEGVEKAEVAPAVSGHDELMDRVG